jgi:nicotinate-nucleotide adenylyltransferase
LPPPHYTIDTLDALRSTYPQHDFHVLIGADNWQQLPQWKDYRCLLAGYQLIVYPRFGYDQAIDTEKFPNVHVCNAPRMEISSSFIREAIAQGKNMDCFLPPAVVEYIESNQLYQ